MIQADKVSHLSRSKFGIVSSDLACFLHHRVCRQMVIGLSVTLYEHDTAWPGTQFNDKNTTEGKTKSSEYFYSMRQCVIISFLLWIHVVIALGLGGGA